MKPLLDKIEVHFNVYVPWGPAYVERNSNLTCQIYVMKCLSDRDAKMQEWGDKVYARVLVELNFLGNASSSLEDWGNPSLN